MTQKDGFGHEKPYTGETNSWITPRWVIAAFDSLSDTQFFDLDPCISMPQPWVTAKHGYDESANGLKQNWYGMVYCNPPYGNNVGMWADKMAAHGNGVMLIFARMETAVWHDIIFPTASGFLFPRRRIAFARPDGTTPKSSAGAPSVFVAWGALAKVSLVELCLFRKIEGAFVDKAICGR